MKKQLHPKKWSISLSISLLTFSIVIGISIACKDNKDIVINEVQQTTSNSYLKFDGKELNHVNADFRKIKEGDGYDKEFNILMTSISSPNMANILSKLNKNFKLNEDLSNTNLVVVYLKKTFFQMLL